MTSQAERENREALAAIKENCSLTRMIRDVLVEKAMKAVDERDPAGRWTLAHINTFRVLVESLVDQIEIDEPIDVSGKVKLSETLRTLMVMTEGSAHYIQAIDGRQAPGRQAARASAAKAPKVKKRQEKLAAAVIGALAKLKRDPADSMALAKHVLRLLPPGFEFKSKKSPSLKTVRLALGRLAEDKEKAHF